MKTYRAINQINCNGKSYGPGQVIDPCEQVSEQSLEQWHKKGLVSADGEPTPPREIVEVTNDAIEPGKSRRGGKSLPKAPDEPKD